MHQVAAMESEAVLFRDQDKTGFFHETYFDYLFAQASTNLPIPELRTTLGDRVASRLAEMTERVGEHVLVPVVDQPAAPWPGDAPVPLGCGWP
ncbi:hypothetical protein [Streptomyces sp. NPDC058424]|uniref:hypothetical protein n=1 Tax=Streptomyces sp. NPDC058424 TaxID=3346491 RepID=UPI00365A08BF